MARQRVGQEFVILISLAAFAAHSHAGYPPGVMGKTKFFSILKIREMGKGQNSLRLIKFCEMA